MFVDVYLPVISLNLEASTAAHAPSSKPQKRSSLAERSPQRLRRTYLRQPCTSAVTLFCFSPFSSNLHQPTHQKFKTDQPMLTHVASSGAFPNCSGRTKKLSRRCRLSRSARQVTMNGRFCMDMSVSYASACSQGLFFLCYPAPHHHHIIPTQLVCNYWGQYILDPPVDLTQCEKMSAI